MTKQPIKRHKRRSDQEHAKDIESLSKEPPEYGIEALISTIDDDKVLRAALRDALWRWKN